MDEPEPRARPPGDLLGQPAEVDHRERHGRQHLDHEVAVRDGVERVGGHPVEAQLRRGRLAVQRVPGAGQRPGTQRRDVEPSARIQQATAIPLQHLDVGEQVVGEQRPAAPAGCASCRAAPRRRRARQGRPAPAPAPTIPAASRSTARRVHSRRSVATWSLRERPVWSLPPTLPTRSVSSVSRFMWTSSRAGSQAIAPASTSSRRPTSPRSRTRDLVLGQQPGPSEPADVCDRAGDVVQRERRVDLDRAREIRHSRVRPLAEPTAPQLHGSLRAE